MINPRKYLYLAPEPGDTGGTDSGSDDSQTTPPTDPPESTVVEPPADKDDSSAKLPNDQTPAATKIDALFDQIGKDEDDEETPAKPVTKPTKTDDEQDQGDKPAKETAKPDPDLTAPEGINERAKTRWTELASRASQVPVLEQRAAAAESQVEAIRTVVQQSGLDPQEFGNALEMGRLFKSNDPTDLQSALEQIDALRIDVATRLGVDMPGVDPLAKHPDLAQEVEDMTISRDRAIEFAKLRDKQAKLETSEQSTKQERQQVASFEAAAKDMDASLAKLASTPGHEAKVGFIREQFSDPKRVQEFVTTYKPEQWKSVILMMYNAYTPPTAAAPRVPQPLRPGHVGNGVRQMGNKPVSAETAVENAWGAIGM